MKSNCFCWESKEGKARTTRGAALMEGKAERRGTETVSKLGWQRYGRCVDTQSQNRER